jgi:hypothetical protein
MHAYSVLYSKDIYYGKSYATSNLVEHIARHHKEEYKMIMHEQANKRQCMAADTDST